MKKSLKQKEATPGVIKDLVFDALMEDFPIAFYWTDAEGLLLGGNKTELKILGLSSPEEFVGKYIANFSTGKAWENSLKVLRENKAHTYEETHTDANGKVTYYFSVKKPLHDSAGKLVGMVGVAIDVTDRKKAEEYRIKHEAAEKVVKFTNLVAGSIAHELRTPLTVISTQMDVLEFMLDSVKQSPEEKINFAKQVVESIKGVIKAATHVISDMLVKIRAFATDQLPQNTFEEISISSDIEHLLETFVFENGEQDLVKTCYDHRFKYLGDKTLTHHVLANLLKNSLHAIKEADKGEITIETRVCGDFNQLIFKDTATGISKDFVTKIFDQFETKKNSHSGIGLGLAFCKMVMEYYGGSITCESQEGEYTKFILNFPKIGNSSHLRV